MRNAIMLAALLSATIVQAASTLDKTPGIESPTPTRPGEVDFFFSHDFVVNGPKLSNSPTFLLEGGLLPGLALGVQYASNSDIGNRVNEVFPQLKYAVLTEERAPLALTAIAGYDTAGRSVDGTLVLARRFSFLRAYATARGFSNGYDVGGATFAGSLGLEINLGSQFAIVGDVGKVLAAHHLDAIQAFSDKVAWSGGITFKLPYTPHSISLYATNVTTHTPEGTSRAGIEAWRFGFEFDVPIRNFARYAALFHSSSADTPAAAPAPASPSTQGKGPTVTVELRRLKFTPAEITVAPGTTVTWTNDDDVPHTVTSKDGQWDSGPLPPGQSFSHTFDTSGRNPYLCAIHPFMTGTVVVR